MHCKQTVRQFIRPHVAGSRRQSPGGKVISHWDFKKNDGFESQGNTFFGEVSTC